MICSFVLLISQWGATTSTLPQEALGIPIVQQQTDYSCGAAALLAVLKYWQVFDGKESDLYKDLDTRPDYGTDPIKLADVAKNRFGLEAKYKNGSNILLDALLKALGEHYTMILDFQAWGAKKPTLETNQLTHFANNWLNYWQNYWKDTWADGHYAVLLAMDNANAYLMDPVLSDAYVYVPLDELLERWHDVENQDIRVEHQVVFIRGNSPLQSGPVTRQLVRLE